MINAEDSATSHGCTESADLWWEVSGANVRKNRECCESMMVRHVNAHRGSINLGIFPRNGEEDRCVAECAEIIRIVRVLPQIVRVDHYKSPKSLLKAGIELVALPRTNRRLKAIASNHVEDYRVRRPQARQNQVFIERRFQH